MLAQENDWEIEFVSPEIEALVATLRYRRPETFGSSFECYVELVRSKSPELDHFFGSFLGNWLRAGLYASGAPGGVPDWLGERYPRKIAHFLPDNPGYINSEGGLEGAEQVFTKPLWRKQIEDYFRSLSPVGRPGRPPGTGIFRSRTEFIETMMAVKRELSKQRRAFSEPNVAEFFNSHPSTLPNGANSPDVRQLRRWFKDPGGFNNWSALDRYLKTLS
ncbi:MAG: hypothetical protein M1358_00845 [Chloroflexi bacterium]|nr:hypothetical protein [Chloroflexota bacterium]